MILSPTGSCFTKLLAETLSSGKDALKYTFIWACQSANYIVDTRDFIFTPGDWGSRGIKGSPKRRKRREKSPIHLTGAELNRAY